MATIKIAVAEDKKLARQAIVKFLHTEVDFEVVIEAENGKTLIEKLSGNVKPDIILVDIQMPVMNGIEATKIILQNDPTAKIIAWTILEDEEHVITMNTLGVKSFLGKKDNDEIFKAIRIVHSGGVYLPDHIAKVLKAYLEKRPAVPCPLKLSSFELVLIKAICKGYSSSKIGGLIEKSPRTVEDYRNELYEKFQVTNKEQFVVKATMWGLT